MGGPKVFTQHHIISGCMTLPVTPYISATTHQPISAVCAAYSLPCSVCVSTLNLIFYISFIEFFIEKSYRIFLKFQCVKILKKDSPILYISFL